MNKLSIVCSILIGFHCDYIYPLSFTPLGLEEGVLGLREPAVEMMEGLKLLEACLTPAEANDTLSDWPSCVLLAALSMPTDEFLILPP